MQVSGSLQGQVIPYVTGRTRISSNLVWYGNFQSHGSGGSSKGGGGAPTSYTYTAAFIAALCLGPIKGIFTVYHDRSLVTLTYEDLSYALGTTGQPIWAGYPNGTPAIQQIPYSNIAYVACPNYNFGGSASMPNLTYEVEGGVGGYSDANGILDADISAVIVDYLTNPITGAGFIGTIDMPSLQGPTNTFQAYCMSLGLMVSNYENNQRAATDFMKEIMQVANSDFVLSCGTLRVVPYADVPVSGTTADGQSWSYAPKLTPIYIFNDGDYCPKEGDEPVKLKRKALSDTYNIVNIEFLDRSNYYNPSPASASDNWDISIRGPRCMATVTLHEITSATVAKTVSQLILNWQLYERNTYQFRVRADYWLLDPMDYIGINDSGLGIANQVCRIIQIDDDEDNYLTFTVMEVPGTIRNTPQYNWDSAQGYFLNFDAAPGNVQPPAIFVMPPVAAAISDGITIGIAVSAPTSGTFWGGCNVYASVDGGSTYGYVGVIGFANGEARYGTLTAPIAALADPDTTSTLAVALWNTSLQLSTTVTPADADDCQTLILVGSGATAEVMSYGNGALVSAGNYDLSYLRRGLYGSQPQAQASGALFVRLDSSIFQIALDPGSAGQQIFFKFCSFNTVGRNLQELSAVTGYPYTIPAALPVSGGNMWTVQGTNVGVNANGTQIYKSGGVNAWDSAAYSPQPFLNGCFITWTAAGSLAASQMIGLSYNPAVVASYTTLNFGLELNAGALDIYESGVQIIGPGTGGSFGAYAIGDTFEVRYDGVTVRYFQNGALLRATRAAGLKFSPKVCLYSATSVVGALSYGPSSAVNQPTGSLINTYSWIIGTPGSQGNFIDESAPGLPSRIVLAGSGSAPLGPYGNSEAIWQGQASTDSNPSGGWENRGDLYGYDPTKTYRSIAWFQWNGFGNTAHLYFGCDPATTNNLNGTNNLNPYFVGGLAFSGNLSPGKWYLAVGFIHGAGYPGADSGLSGVYDPVSGNQVYVGTDYVSIAGAPYQMHRAFNFYDGSDSRSIVWIAKPRFEEVNGNEPTLQAIMAPASALQGFVSTGEAVMTGTTVSKLSGPSAWDSCAYSVNGYDVCHIAGKPIAGHFEMLGLSSHPARGSSYTNGDYLWYYGNGTWYIFESGVDIGSYGPALATDLVEVLCDGTNINYLLNKVVMRTVAAAALPLYAFMPLEDVGGGWNSVDFGPTGITGVIDTTGLGANAATNTSQVTISAVSVPNSSIGVNTAIAQVTVGPFPVACTVVITASGQWTGDPTVSESVNFWFSKVGSTSPTNFATVQISAIAAATGVLALEATDSLAANTTQTYYLVGVGLGSVGHGWTATAAMLKAEAIKK
jgi:hypothetical protein